MLQSPNCPACGAPLPDSQSPAGVVCEYCGIFIRAERPIQAEQMAGTKIDQPPRPEIEVISPQGNTFSNPELNWDSAPQWREIKMPRWRTLRRSLLSSILIVVALVCFSCFCLLTVLDKPLQRLFNSLSR
ncbi:hypothetical protein BECAL_01478 [Bellilinea caldifistulae]|uniref:Uncharacterized protein n=1 Tax=Bellilinea caldifistulae TaxID=360411 RepID=A0A0P6WYE8_9CHLR|nr:hypothetical protein [Bellilinea caldifistulae]KPL73669.1 hypothetical protein AC812_14965 [Bellilinea caldifistulae]GAP10311.1 hypothetical protein BECAL_01478 [Bellilinea caldifistulae]